MRPPASLRHAVRRGVGRAVVIFVVPACWMTSTYYLPMLLRSLEASP